MKYFYFLIIWFILTPCVMAQNVNQPAPRFEETLNSPIEIKRLSEGHYFIDFGKSFFGTVVLKSKKTQTDSLVIHLGEKLATPESIDRKPGGTIRYQRVVINEIMESESFPIQLKPDKRNTKPQAIALPDSFGVLMPFRYCEIENLHIAIEDFQVYQKAYHYAFNDEASYFKSSDPILDSIYDLCKHTIKATSFTGYYVDGDRERIPYEADAYINQLSHYAVDSVYSVARRTNEYFIDHATWPTEWLLHTVMLFYQDYMYTGDLSSIKKYYDVLKLKTLQDLARTDGLISSSSKKLTPEIKILLGFEDHKTKIKDIVDWPMARGETGKKWLPEFGERDGYDMVEINTVVNSFFYHNMMLMYEIALVLEKTSDAKVFHEKAELVKKSVNEKLFDKTNGIYTDGEDSDHSSLHANMFPLAFGLVPDEYKKSVVDFIKTRGMACSVYGAQYLLEGLCKYGEEQYALYLITDTVGDRNWYNMLRLGSTMTLEAWDMKYKSNLDWNHAWGTAPLNIIARYIWGITPAQPEFKNIQISPHLGNLSHSNIKVPTVNGCIIAEYQTYNNKKQIYNITLPKNTEARFFINENPKKIILNDEKLDFVEPYIVLKNKTNKIELNF